MERLLVSIAKLDRWAIENHIDLSNELSSIESKIRLFHKNNTVNNEASSSPIKQVKPRKTSKPAPVPSLKKSKKKEKSKQPSLQHMMTTINFDVSSKLIKGISYCHFCKVKRLECREHSLLSGSKILVCKDCRQHRHKPYLRKKKKLVTKEDALNYLVSGSYGSGKASR